MKTKLIALAALLAIILPVMAKAQVPVATPVYVTQLPSVVDITNGAQTAGYKVIQIRQSVGQTTVTYQLSNGQVCAFTYLPLPVQSEQVIVTQPAATVIYNTAPVYVPSYPIWPFVVGLAAGDVLFGGYYHGGYYRNDWHGGGHGGGHPGRR